MVTFTPVDQLPLLKVAKGGMRHLSGDKLTVMWGKRGKGSTTARHSHPHEQIAWLVSGKLDCRIGDGPVLSLDAGVTFIIPGGVEHEFWYREDCEIVEIFSPPRHDLFPVTT
jgi:quercetin dioxygenase-like cupin family protein